MPAAATGSDATPTRTLDPRTPCLIGWSQHTWPKSVDVDAPEPLDMWEFVTRQAAAATGSRSDVLGAIDRALVVYTQSWPYDDPVARLSERLGMSPRHRLYSGIGGTTPQVLLQETAAAMLRGESELAIITSAEALDTVKKIRSRGERPAWSFRDPEKKPFPFEAPFLPAEVAHDIFQAWLTFAMFDNARRAHLGVGLAEHRVDLAEMWHQFSKVAAANPDAWFPIERSTEEILRITPGNRMIGYPYTKFMVSVMDVDMAACLILASHEKADRLGVPTDQRVYLRGWGFATDPHAVAGHRDMWRSPAMTAASAEAFAGPGLDIDDLAHLDLYSCFASSIDFARDALGIAATDPRPLTVTGGLPYFGGAGSGYMTHSIASMADALRDDPGSYGMVSGVGMHMTKHVFGVYSTTPGELVAPDLARVQAGLDAAGHPTIADVHEGPATVAAYSITHDHEGPSSGVVVLDLPDADSRAYAKVTDPELLLDAEERELVGRQVTVSSDGRVNTARW
jgi:acetyl-CoA C-acetyltransferase